MMSLSVISHTVNLTLATFFIDNYLLTYNVSCGEDKSAVFDAARDHFLTIFQNNRRILRSADPGTVKTKPSSKRTNLAQTVGSEVRRF